MARTAIVAQTPPLNAAAGYYPATPLIASSANLTWTGNSDPTNRQTTITEAKTLLLAQNTDTTAHTISITSVPDSQNRTGDISGYSIAPGAVACFGPFRAAGWGLSGQLQIDVSDSHIEMAVLTLP